ncbi:MAG: cell wall-binding repeat-containing protein [Tissierellia bacterium]|nr:cell wall-binding repeat-containing protein [Tissierellia bacterium]
MRITSKKLLALLIVFVMVFAAIPMQPALAANGEFEILHTNDIHGNVVGDEDIEKGEKIGFAKYKTFIDQEKETKNVLVVDVGDLLHGTTFATISRGESMVELANRLGVDAFTPGNHDFNYGTDRLVELEGQVDFQILASNVIKEGETDPIFENFTIKEIGGIKVGIFGIATPETKTKSNPLNTEGVNFIDPIKAAEDAVAALTGKVDVIVALSHLGLDKESEITSEDLAVAVPEIDIIIDGHSHTQLDAGKKVGDTLIAQTGGHLKQIGKVNVKVEDGKVTAEAALIPFAEAFALEPNKDIADYIASVEEDNKPYLETIIGKTKTDLVGEREIVRTGESNLGQLLTIAMLMETDADVAITNGGGIRATIKAGDITRGDVLLAFPFTNYPVVIEATGQVIVDALNHGIDAYPEAAGKFPHVAGMNFEIEKTAEGNRVKDLMIKDQPVDLTKTYKLVTNDFMAVGGDGYEMFKGLKKLSEHALLSEVLENRIVAMAKEGEIEVNQEQRIRFPSAAELPKRIAGDNRYLTAVEISKEGFAKAETVLIASGTVEWDSLSAGPLASLKGAPILLTEGNKLTTSAGAEIKRLEAKNAILIGGERTLEKAVEDELKGLGLTVSRISGPNRYETSAEVAKTILKETSAKKLMVASGDVVADALSASSLASKDKTAILLINGKGNLAPSATALIKEQAITEIVIAGGESTVLPAVEEALKTGGVTVTRLAGLNRYETAVAIAKAAYPEGEKAFVANGLGFADALAVAPYAHKEGAVLLLVQPEEVPEATANYLKDSKITTITVIGGTNSVSDDVAGKLK